jgi:hypothetical protein
LLLALAACEERERLTWYPIYPLPGETAVLAERTFALQAYGVVEDPPCDAPARLPDAWIRDVETDAWIETHARCASPFVHVTPRTALIGERAYELHVWLDPDDDWDEPVFGTRAARDDNHVAFPFSTARRPEVLRAVWSGESTAYLMFSQDLGDDYMPTIDVRAELGGPETSPTEWWIEKQWFTGCDSLGWCDGNYFSRQHIVIATPPRRVPLVVAGTAADGTPFGPIRVEPED